MTPDQQRRAQDVVQRLQEELPNCAFMLIGIDAGDGPDFDDSLTMVANIGDTDAVRLLRHLADRIEERARTGQDV